jgi:uncharacterized protein
MLEVDVLRGFAVLGMVIWDFGSRAMGHFHVSSRADYYVSRVIAVSDIENTVHLVFAFLFGWGLAQAWRKDAPGRSLAATNARRLLALFVMGMATACLLDRTDFLRYLAVMGVVLLMFKDLSNRAVLALALVVVAGPVLGGHILTSVLSPEAYAGSHLWASLDASSIQSASYGEIVVIRAREALLDLLHPRMYVENLDMLVALLLGLYAARRAVFRDIPSNLGLIRRAFWMSLLVHLLGEGWIFDVQHPEIAARLGVGWIVNASWTAGLLAGECAKHALALFYVCLVVLLLRRPGWRVLLRPLADVGRVALSNYFLHDLIATTIFFGYGLGLYEKLGMAVGESVAIVAFAAMMALSRWWLRRFAFGPAEWLWRTVTYWEPQRFRLPRAAPSGSL